MISIIVSLGFIKQGNMGDLSLGDEFDHLAPIAKAQCNWELVIVDRAWPTRFGRVEEALGSVIDRVKYVPCKPSRMVEIGYRAVNAQRNSGAIVSQGDLLMFLDDFLLIDPLVVDEIHWTFYEQGLVLCPVIREDDYPLEKYGDALTPFSGHNPGIYMAKRCVFEELGGFDENYDGAYGEEDTDWQNRLDIYLEVFHLPHRQRRRGVIFPQTKHRNGKFPEPRFPPWSIETDPEYLRCNRVFYQRISGPRIEDRDWQGNRKLTDEERSRLRVGSCSPACGVCKREDRPLQLKSYRVMGPDEHVVTKMRMVAEGGVKVGSGSFNPWSEIQSKLFEWESKDV
jgi:hypothetical protein